MSEILMNVNELSELLLFVLVKVDFSQLDYIHYYKYFFYVG